MSLLPTVQTVQAQESDSGGAVKIKFSTAALVETLELEEDDSSKYMTDLWRKDLFIYVMFRLSEIN